MDKAVKSVSLNRKSGSALITTMILVGIISVILAWILRYSVSERRVNHRHKLRAQTTNVAEAIVEYGFAQLSYTFNNNTTVASTAFNSGGSGALALPPAASLRNNVDYSNLEIYSSTVPSSSFIYIDPNEPDNLFDPLKGKYVRAFEVSLYAKAVLQDPNNGPDLTAYVTQDFQVRDSPLFSHAIFYNLDLDLHPAPPMDIHGPVHTNGELRVAPIDYLKFHDIVTTSGHIYHQYEHTSTSRTGQVYFKNGSGSLLGMKVSDVWKDSKMGGASVSEDFRSYASNRWEGYLQTSAHGVSAYNPVAFAEYVPDDTSTGAYDPINSGRAIIEPPLLVVDPEYNAEVESQKMSNKAGLYFKWDTATGLVTAYTSDGGTLLNITNLDGSLWELKPDVMFDRRRGEYISMIDIHVGKLKQLIENPDTSDSTMHIGGYDPSSDWNGVVYFQCYSTDLDPAEAARLNYTGVRLYGGETDVTGEGIPSRGSDPGMSFVTNNALYVRGHFNTDGNTSTTSSYTPEAGEVPVAVMGDSITFLSESWDDSDTSVKPPASTTEVSAAAVSGIRPPDVQGDGSFSGGAHNFPRFLENWSGNTFFLRGSMVCLYESEVDFSTWSTSYYSPPNRGYGFNDLFASGTYPPGTPLLRTYRRESYRNLNASEYTSLTSGL